MHALSIGIVSPELEPYWSSGGIGSGLRGFSEALLRRGHSVTCMIAVPKRPGGSLVAEHWLADSITAGGREAIRVEEILEPNGLRVLLFELPSFDTSYGGYGPDVSSDPLAARRMGLFARAVLAQIELEIAKSRLDVVHAHEWPTAMVHYLMRERGLPIAKVLTIHNLAHQGIFPTSALAWFGLGPEHAVMERLELYGCISLLKGGIWAADQLTTVSPSYAEEILRPERGELLDGVLRCRREVLSGIVNGIDVNHWNPATDAALAARYDARSLAGKQTCKRALSQQMRLLDAEKPLFVSLGRLVEQKGIDSLLGALPAIVGLGGNVLIAGLGESSLTQDVERAVSLYSGRARFLGHASDEDARRLLAAADFLLMPSRWEPCGVVQLQAMRYGALPIVRRTGGLVDTVVDAEERPLAANGYVFDGESHEALVSGVKRALLLWRGPEDMRMRCRGMLASLGWEGPLRAYEAVYRRAMGESRA